MKNNIKRTISLFFLIAFLINSPLYGFAQSPTISLSDAILKSLEENPGVKIEETEIEQMKGLVQKAAGEFDWVIFASGSRETRNTPVSTREQENQQNQQDQQNEQQTAQNEVNQEVMTFLGRPYTPFPPVDEPIVDEIEETINQYSAGVTKKFRTGIQVTPSVSTYDYQNNTDVPDPESNSEMSLEIVFPLLRGLGTKYTGAQELAAKSALEAARQLSKHNISEQIYLTTVSFWNCLAAVQNHEILEETEKRAVEVYSLVERFIKAGEAGPDVIHEANAKLHQRRVDLRNSKLNVYESRLAMALAMGYKPMEMPKAPLPIGNFPEVVEDFDVKQEIIESYLTEAMNRRGDYLAAKTGVETEGILLGKARNDKKPRVDFTVRAGYRGFDDSDGSERFYHSLNNNNTGPNYYAGIRGELPIFNNLARGETLYRKSTVKQAQLKAELLSNHIGSEVLVAIERLRASLKEYRQAKQSEEAYRKAADHENYKVKEGLSGLSDLINIEDRYYRARAIRVNVTRRYANALAELRFVTGTLLTDDDEKLRVKIQDLMEPPSLNPPEEKSTK